MLCTVQHYSLSLSLSCTVSDGGSKINKLATVVVMTVVDHHGHLEAIKPLSFALHCFSLWGLLLQALFQAKLSFWFLLVETLESKLCECIVMMLQNYECQKVKQDLEEFCEQAGTDLMGEMAAPVQSPIVRLLYLTSQRPLAIYSHRCMLFRTSCVRCPVEW